MKEPSRLRSIQEARDLLDRGRAAERTGAVSLAHELLTQSLRRLRRLRERQGIADALVEMVRVAGHFNRAGRGSSVRRKARCEEALAIYGELGDQGGEARALRALSTLVDGEEATQLVERSLAKAREANDLCEIAASLLSLAHRREFTASHRLLAQRLDAREAFGSEEATALREEALAVSRGSGDRQGEAEALSDLAAPLRRADPHRSLALTEKALAIYRELDDRPQMLRSLGVLGSLYEEDQARIDCQLECRQLSHELGWWYWEIDSLRDLADLFERRGEVEHAQALRAETIELWPPFSETISGEIEDRIKPLSAEEAKQRATEVLRGIKGLSTLQSPASAEEPPALLLLAPLLREFFKTYSYVAPTHAEFARVVRPESGAVIGQPGNAVGVVSIGSEDWRGPNHVVVRPHEETIYYLKEGEEQEGRPVASGYATIYHYLLSLKCRFS